MSGTPDLDDPQSAQVDTWGKLVSLNSYRINSQDLTTNEITIGRNSANIISINDNRLSGQHCKLMYNKDSGTATLTDTSTNGTFLGDHKIGKGNDIIVKNGDEIFLLHKTKVPQSDIIGFAILINQIQESKIIQKDEKQEEKIKKIDQISEDINCVICDDVIYQAVTLMPCLHNFCGACFSDWMAKQKTCPTCRKEVSTVSRNPMVNNLVEKYLELHPDKKRPKEEYQQMDEANKIKNDILNFSVAPTAAAIQQPPQAPSNGRGRGRGRGRAQSTTTPPIPSTNRLQEVSDYSASSDDDTALTRECQTCKKEINGFKCKGRGQVHVTCTNCSARMPRLPLTDKSLPHFCVICENSFCTLYYKGCEKMSKTNPLRHFKDGPVPDNVDVGCFRQNPIEQKLFSDYLRDKRISCQDLFKHMCDNYVSKGLFRYVVNKRTHIEFRFEKNIVFDMDTPVCTKCFQLVWQQLVFRYRIAMRDQMQGDIKNRGYCWYGINCKTMIHNQDHAKKLDHMCEQTKF